MRQEICSLRLLRLENLALTAKDLIETHSDVTYTKTPCEVAATHAVGISLLRQSLAL